MIRFLPAGALVLVLVACATRLEHHPVPEALVGQVEPLGISGLRFHGDEAPADLAERTERWIERMRIDFADAQGRDESPVFHYLALSGGGEWGAFGAGFLVGWTAAGTRPEFRGVTGVSTGSLIAPLAFLGPEYDDELREVYTEISGEDVFKTTLFAGITGGSALADNSPLRSLIERYATQEILDRIAEETQRGRMLWIGTTNLESGRPVIWDIGALANSGHPRALEMFRDILTASAAMPVLFPPVVFDVEADGQRFTELHVDGGTTSQVFLYPAQIRPRDLDEAVGVEIERHLWIIRNSRQRPAYATVEPKLLPIAGHSVSAIIKNQGNGDLHRLFLGTLRDGIAFNLLQVPEEFGGEPPEPFDQQFMNDLFEFGHNLAQRPDPWVHGPPGFEDGMPVAGAAAGD